MHGKHLVTEIAHEFAGGLESHAVSELAVPHQRPFVAQELEPLRLGRVEIRDGYLRLHAVPRARVAVPSLTVDRPSTSARPTVRVHSEKAGQTA